MFLLLLSCCASSSISATISSPRPSSPCGELSQERNRFPPSSFPPFSTRQTDRPDGQARQTDSSSPRFGFPTRTTRAPPRHLSLVSGFACLPDSASAAATTVSSVQDLLLQAILTPPPSDHLSSPQDSQGPSRPIAHSDKPSRDARLMHASRDAPYSKVASRPSLWRGPRKKQRQTSEDEKKDMGFMCACEPKSLKGEGILVCMYVRSQYE